MKNILNNRPVKFFKISISIIYNLQFTYESAMNLLIATESLFQKRKLF